MKLLFDHFNKLTEASGGAKKLRELILQLAIQGKLLPQDPKDEPASVLLEKIQTEKFDYIRKNNIRTNKSTVNEYVKNEFSIPTNWIWTSIDNIVLFVTDYQANGSFASLRENVSYFKSEEFAVLVRLKDLRKNLTQNDEFVYTDKKGYEFLSKSFLEGGEILVANVGAGVGTTLIMPNINFRATLAPNMFKVIPSMFLFKKYFKV